MKYYKRANGRIFTKREKVSHLYDVKVFSRNFRRYFFRSGMTVRKFLKMSGVGKSAFYNWISGKNIPYMRNIETICRIFKINVKDLMGEEIK